MQMDILVIDGKVVDAAIGGRDPRRHLAGLEHRTHQALDEPAIGIARNPGRRVRAPGVSAHRRAAWIDRGTAPGTDGAAEARARKRELEGEAGFGDEAVPALHPDLAIADIGA